jgi:TPR repeat protein
MSDKPWEKNASEEAIRLRKKAVSYMEQENLDEDGVKEALGLIEKAAELGDAEAQSEIADVFRTQNDLETALYWEKKAAEQGYPKAQNNVAYHYQNGLGTPVDPGQQFYWYKKAAENGFTESIHSLAVCYLVGVGTAQNLNEGVAWLKRAVADGHAAAKRRLGAAYIEGVGGLAPDAEKGWALLREAADSGDELAQGLIRDKNGGNGSASKGGCYIATCVYGSYDCPEVWTLRRYRDGRLSKSWLGRVFIRGYYAVSPKVVALFGDKKWFCGACKPIINNLVRKLRDSGMDSGPYSK